ncbi:hypothetical protein F5Y19DRAFT_442855 [Xylariaceae sp. FL1651]|nr:hypothetical protein F5Y19DRAFT_442855 [Xylariaceae sp. FL1651]
MSPPRRRSARLASSSVKSKASPAPQLASVAESDEPVQRPSRSHSTVMSSPTHNPSTPSAATPVKLPMSEMHPSKIHRTMAPPSSGLRHGFTDIDYNAPAPSLVQNTPSKTPAPSSEFTFRSVRPSTDTELGPEARRIMEEVREDAARIKVELTAARARELAEQAGSSDGRKIATAKGKASRFSAVHLAEFKKMDSIEGHASSFRAAPGRFVPVKAITPVKAGIKRSQSKADLGEPDSARSKTVPARLLARSIDRPSGAPESPSKRVRQRLEDDASTLRPVSRDGSFIPRPKSSGNDSLRTGIPRSQTHGNLMTPTKSSLARTNSVKTPTVSLVGSPGKPELHGISSFSAKVENALLKSPIKSDLGIARSPSKKSLGGLTKSATLDNLSSESSIPTRVQTPGRFDRVKSILKRHISGTKSKSAVPRPTSSLPKTPSHHVTMKMFPPVPLTTPGRKHDRHVDFTPETKRASMVQESPSPVKSGIPRSKTLPKLPAPNFTTNDKAANLQPNGEVAYPDLSAYEVSKDNARSLPESVPGTFTFRSDHTIRFDSSPSKGFGSAAGQASLRQVRESTIHSIRMPGSFPRASETSPNKENRDPTIGSGIPHGMPNKKRHRASADEDEDDEGSKRGMKKLRKDPPAAEGHAVVAPRLANCESPTKKIITPVSRTPSPQKKKTGLSLSRLNMLARPKVRN